MNKEKLWSLFIKHNPRLVDDPHFTPESVRRFFDAVWNIGYECGAKDWAERQEEIQEAKLGKNPGVDLFAALLEALAQNDDDETQDKKKTK
jgi:hypothetical protein